MSEEKDLKLKGIRPDGIETLEGGLENYQEEQEEDVIELTFEEKKYLLRKQGKRPTDEEIEALTEKDIEELVDYSKFLEKKMVYRYVNRVKTVDDEVIKDLSDEDVEDLIAKSLVMSKHLTYNPKKKYDVRYKKKRQNKNKLTRSSRKANR